MRLDIRTRVLILCCVLALAAVYGGSLEADPPDPAETPVRVRLTGSPTAVPPAAATPTATQAAATATPQDVAAATATLISGPAATAAPAGAATPTAASTAAPTQASTAAPTAAATQTAAPAATAAPTASATPVPTPAVTRTATPSPEPTATTGALPLEALARIEFVRGDGTAVSLPVEIPPRTEYSIGLSGRYELGERGMLFHYEEEVRRSFWMKNTHFDLDIAFIGADFVIREIFGMEAESLEIRRPAEVYQYAVEAPAGWYAANGVQVGDTARLAFDLDDYPVE